MAESKSSELHPRVTFNKPAAPQNFEDIDFTSVTENDRELLQNCFENLLKKKEKLSIKNKMLSSAVGHYFMEKKITRAFHELSDAENLENKLKYEQTMENLKKLWNEMEKSNGECEEKINEVMKELEQENAAKNEIKNDLTSTIQTKAAELITAGVPITEKFVTRLLTRYEKVSDELFEARLNLKKTQNALDEIKSKDEEMDDLGDGYKVVGFENLKTELQTISANIDARNEELEKLRMRYNSSIEKSDELKNKIQKLESKIEKLKKIYNEKKVEEQGLRWQVNDSRKQKELLRAEFDKLLEQSQLLTKTSLLRNFDSINDEIGNLNQEIGKFQEEEIETLKKVNEMKVESLPQKIKKRELKNFHNHEQEKFKNLIKSISVQKI